MKADYTKGHYKLMKDVEILAVLHAHGVGADLKLATDEFSPFDAEGQSVIVELKHTERNLASYLIHLEKLAICERVATFKNKDFYYIVVTKYTIYIWNVSNLMRITNPTIESLMLPKQFDKPNEKISKLVTRFSTMDAIRVITRKDAPPC